VNYETLRRKAPDVSALWDLGERLSAAMLAADSQASAEAHAALGTSLLPELRSQKYAAGFGDELVNTLKGYTEPPKRREPPTAEVLERDALPLVVFIAPKFPSIALQARLTGDVRLRVTVNPETGSVTNVERLVDVPLLGAAAEDAVRAWKFDPARAPREPVDVTAQFRLRCGSD